MLRKKIKKIEHYTLEHPSPREGNESVTKMSVNESDEPASAFEVILPAVGDAPVQHSEATSGVELWLLRVPRHNLLRESLVGKEVSLAGFLEPQLSASQSQGQSQDPDSSASNAIRSNYRFEDAGLSAAALSVRAAFPSDASSGPTFKLGPAFIRQVNVTFSGIPSEPVTALQPTRMYPVAPSNLSVKYCVIGPHKPEADLLDLIPGNAINEAAASATIIPLAAMRAQPSADSTENSTKQCVLSMAVACNVLSDGDGGKRQATLVKSERAKNEVPLESIERGDMDKEASRFKRKDRRKDAIDTAGAECMDGKGQSRKKKKFSKSEGNIAY
jgi:hypothetical protein